MRSPIAKPSAAPAGRSLLSQALDHDSPLARSIRRRRRLVSFALCGLISVAAFLAAFALRFELSAVDRSPVSWWSWFAGSVGIVAGVRLLVFAALGLHRTTWRYAGARDVVPVAVGVALGSLLLVPTLLWVWDGWFPRSVLVMEGLICFLLLAAARFSYRLVRELVAGFGGGGRLRVVVLGAGSAGNLIVRAMQSGGVVGLQPVAILDDDPLKQGTTLQGVPVSGTLDDVARVAAAGRADAIVMALPTATTSQIYRAVQLCRSTGLPLKTIPDLSRILAGSEAAPAISEFRLEDLLHRRPIRPDNPAIGGFLADRTVLVTGAAGSIGAELCRQIAEQGAARLVCLDKDENGLFRLEHALAAVGGGTAVTTVLADVKEAGRIGGIFGRWRPDIVFHAAAYKHVPVLQHHPVEAVRNNVLGTRVVAEAAHAAGVSDFVLISTDKAVNPTSVMGATKRIAERIVRTRDRHSHTRYSAIRFGNVLGSNGSVVELFQKQIRAGGPVTVTHRDIERYFMTIPEAVQLVLFAATLGAGGDTFILDMGKPVRIAELAEQMIRLSGLVPGADVPITFTGLRPGEKLTEELWTAEESPSATDHPGILQAPGGDELDERLELDLERLLAAADSGDAAGLWRSLLALVPTFAGRISDRAHIPPDVPVRGRVLAFPVRPQGEPAPPADRAGGRVAPAAAVLPMTRSLVGENPLRGDG